MSVVSWSVACDINRLAGIVFSGYSSLVIEDLADQDGVIVVRAATAGGPVPCPRPRCRLGKGMGLLECSRRPGLSMNTVKRYARAAEPERLVRAPRRRQTCQASTPSHGAWTSTWRPPPQPSPCHSIKGGPKV
jgi:hypothetical protein